MSEPRWLDDEEQVAWRAYLRASSLVDDLLDRELQRHGVQLSEYEIIALVSEEPSQHMRMSVIADVVVQSRSRLTHTAARLEKRGWVIRRPCDDDKRGVELWITDQGLEAVRRLAPLHVASVREALVDPLGREGFLQLGALMQRIRERLQGLEPSAAAPVDGERGPQEPDVG